MQTISQSRTDLPPARQAAIEATVAALGAEGDGVLHADGASLFVPFVLPGERIRVHREGRQGGDQAVLDAVLEASPDRATPPCGLFGRCGGCMLQHMNAAAMARFKRGLVCDALMQAGFAVPETIGFTATPAAARRRMDLALRRTPTGILVGLHRRAGEVVDLSECHVLEPSLFALIGAMRPMLLRLTCLRAGGSAIVNLLDSGPDLLLATDAAPDTADRSRLADFARAHAIPRIAWRSQKSGETQTETVCLLGPVHHLLSGVRISPPPGAFLQASRESERAITHAVLAGIPAALTGRARIFELYAGCGTLSFALAERGKVSCFEGQKDASACLRQGAGGMRIEVAQRDLVRQPLLAKEFKTASVIVLDPPFAGAGPQMPEIARAGAARVIMVSCNPRALAKDTASLHQAGYGLEQVSVVDQFLWSSSVESVSVFVKAGR